MAGKYVRFVTHQKDEVTGLDIGFFQAAYRLWRENRLPSDDDKALRDHLDWFKDMLDAPRRFHRSTNPHAHGKGLSWFKPEANEHIGRARQIVRILERHGVQSEMLTTLKPGYLLHEDEFQICAVPFKEGA